MNLGAESEQVEFKRSTGEHREAMESIASILNKHGSGVLYFGVRNDGEVMGQDVSDKTLRSISQEIGSKIEPRSRHRYARNVRTAARRTSASTSRGTKRRTPARGATASAVPTRMCS